jgi:hypothetical protein
MKHPVKKFISLEACLKELEPYVRSGKHLETGRPFKRFGGMRSREVLANWLLCVVLNEPHPKERFTFTSDPVDGDGIVYDLDDKSAYPTEHVLVPSGRRGQSAEQLILDAIAHKQNKGGKAYASGKILVVFLNAAAGSWHPNKVARQLNQNVDFEAIWVVGLQRVEDGDYIYAVTSLDLSWGDAPTWFVRIGNGFDSWRVERCQ